MSWPPLTSIRRTKSLIVKNGREEEAKAFLVKYHANGKADDELVAFEYAEIQEALRMERETKQDTWKVILSSRSSRHRLGCGKFHNFNPYRHVTNMSSSYLDRHLPESERHGYHQLL